MCGTNRFGDEGAATIAGGLAANATLQRLGLQVRLLVRVCVCVVCAALVLRLWSAPGCPVLLCQRCCPDCCCQLRFDVFRSCLPPFR